MWTPLDVPIEVSRAGATGIGIEIWDAVAQAPLDLGSMLFTCLIARALGEPPITSFDVEVVDSAFGQIDVEFNGESISVEGVKEIVRLAYEIKSNFGDVLMRGPLYLIPGI